MDSTASPDAGQGGTPAVLSRIAGITRRQTDHGYQFVCELAGGGGTVTVEVPPAALQTYRSFQRAVAEQSGGWFRDEAYEARRGRGAELWADDIERLLGEGPTEI